MTLRKKCLGISSKKVAPNIPIAATKWSDSIREQNFSVPKNLNAKYIALDLIELDPNNPRNLNITINTIKNGPKISEFLPYNEENQKKFEKQTKQYFEKKENAKKQIKDYLMLANLAASIGKPEELIHPITVYDQDNEKFIVCTGHCRALAHFMLNAKYIAAIIKSPTDSILEKSVKQYKENNARENLSLADEIKNISIIISFFEQKTEQMSINKLAELLSLKRTKANWLLSVYKETINNKNYKNILYSGQLTSLEAAYHIAKMVDFKSKQNLINEILNGKRLTFQQLIIRAKNPELTIKHPQKNKLNYGLKIESSNIRVLSKIIQIILRDHLFRNFKNDFEAINLKSPAGIKEAWKKIYSLLEGDSNL